MTKTELLKVMTYIFTDHDHQISENKRDVWFDQFRDVQYPDAMKAARVLMSRKVYGLPRVADFADALRDCERAAGVEMDEGQAFNLALQAVQKFGYMNEGLALAWLHSQNPRVSEAVKTYGFGMLCSAPVADMHCTRAQFGKVFLSTAERAQVAVKLGPKVSNLVSDVVKQLAERKDAN